ncbi:hypothetical protein PPTG_22809 [Phytophthora nicotianae INRA-310]|uniref:Uncharacterized protein n=1 Tax=Phytophthora nicotianae (strain INRA-310) TaxID=761204 RepID=W2QAZ3_PHYN3|nr:hypothetical protein PPTG_22809 [Phytophthora nicotianae INRA-310]ETN10312.1 hypothetical protein PPTG_22809 [Phytophthora nicotianae INRA-310]
MQKREGGVGMGNRKREEAGLIERLAGCSGTNWSVSSILNEVLPEQRHLYAARYLLEPRLQTDKTIDNKKHWTTNTEDKVKRNISVAPLRAPPHSSMGSSRVDASMMQPLVLSSDNSTGVYTPTNSLRGHMLTIWEDKFRFKCLAVEDIMFLLAHPSVADTLESASFLREANLTYDQVMELEMALVMLFGAKYMDSRSSFTRFAFKMHDAPRGISVEASTASHRSTSKISVQANNDTDENGPNSCHSKDNSSTADRLPTRNPGMGP